MSVVINPAQEGMRRRPVRFKNEGGKCEHCAPCSNSPFADRLRAGTIHLMLFTILFSLVAIVLSIGAGVACVLWLPRGRKVGGIEPRCAACGYIVHGLPAPRCPECGADLARPRAIVTTARLPPGRLARSIAWSLFCVLAVVIPAAAVWGAFVMPALPMVRDNSEQVTLSQPASKAYRAIAVRAHAHGMAYPHDPDPLPGDLKIELTRSDGTVRVMAIDSATLHFRDASVPASATSTAPLDTDALVSWLKSAAVQGDNNQINREMGRVMAQVRRVVSRPPYHFIVGGAEFSGMSSGSSGSMNPLPWVGLVPLVIGAVVWGIGMIRIMRKPPAGGDSHMAC